MGKLLKNGLKKAGNIGKAIFKGVFDTILPNVRASFKEKEQAFIDEPIKYRFDFWRLFSAITVWILLLLVFFGKIQFSDITNVLSEFLNEILAK